MVATDDGMRLDKAKRLKKVVADLTLDNAILNEVADPNFFHRHVGGSQ